MTWSAVRLGLRLVALRGPSGVLRTVVLGLAVAAVTVLAQFAATAPFVLGAQQGRADARAAVVLDPDERGVLRYGEVTSTWRGQEFVRVLVSGGPSAPAPPGLEALPQPGQVALSPALAGLTAESPSLAGYFSGYARVGPVGPAGLLRPDELRAVVGVDPQAGRFSPVGGFGAEAGSVTGTGGVFTVVALMFLVVLAAPGAVLVAVATRLSAGLRDRRLVTLRTLGLRPSRMRLLVAVESGVVAAAGALAGLVVFLLLRPYDRAIPWTGLSVYASDLKPPAAVVGAVTLAVPALATLVSLLSVPRRTGDSVRASSEIPRRRIVALAVLIVGLGVLAIAPLLTGRIAARDQFTVLMVGALAVAIGLPVGLPVMLQRLSRHWGTTARHPGTLVGARWTQADPGGAARLGAGMCVALFAFGMAMPVASLLRGDETAGRVGLAAARGLNLTVTDAGRPRLEPDELERMSGVRRVLPVVTLRDRNGLDVAALVASCADLDKLAVAAPSRCDDELAWLSTTDFPVNVLVRDLRPPLRLAADRRVPLPDPDQAVQAGLGPELDGALLVPPRTPHGVPAFGRSGAQPQASFLVNLPDDPDAVEAFRGQLAARAPAADASNDYQEWVSGASRFETPIRWIRLGLGAGLGLAAFALCLAAAGDTVARRHRLGRLLVVGAPPGVRLRAHVVATLGPLAFGAVVSVAAGWVASVVFSAVDDRAFVPWTAYALLLATVLGCLAAVTAVTTPLALRALDTEDLIRE
ncbi:MAG: FtsX-like permease family protein [Streptomycetales bacterium]